MGCVGASTTNKAMEDVLLEPKTKVTYNNKEYEVVKEGLAEILNPTQTQNSNTTKGNSKPQIVFYNPIQQFNRDLSVLAIRVFGDDLAAIRRARTERRLQSTSQNAGRGKKRKRGAVDENKTAEQSPSEGNHENKEGVPPDVRAATNKELPVEDRDVTKPVTEEEHSLSNGMDVAMQAEATDSAKRHHLEHSGNRIKEAERMGDVRTTNDIPMEPAKMRNRGNPTNGNRAAVEIPPFLILDALSATGLRALRYAKEIPSVTTVTANDLSSSATAAINLNITHNKNSDKINTATGDARAHMYSILSHNGQRPYHVIDLDPYGTAAPFLDAAVQAVVDGGLLCVTCTDAGVFASTGYLEKTFSQYGGLPFKGPQSHEGGLRLILHAVATCAARYGRAIEPLLSLSIDFYARVFVRVRSSPAEVKFLASKTMFVYNCDEGCGAWTTQSLAQARGKKSKTGETIYKFSLAQAPFTSQNCEHCGFRTHLSGPMWGGPLHNPYFVQCMLDILPSLDAETYGTIPRMEGMLSLALSEFLDDPTQDIPPSEEPLPAPLETPQPPDFSAPQPIPSLPSHTRSNHPFFIIPSVLAKVLHAVSPSDAAFRGALLHLGYRASRSHTKPGSIVTDAPWSVIWEIMREWVRQKSPVKEGAIRKGTAGWDIMRKDRSKIALIEATDDIRRALDVDDPEDLRTGVEAALYRLSKTKPAAGEHNQPLATDPRKQTGPAPANGDISLQDHTTEPTKPRASPLTLSNPSYLTIVFDERLGKESSNRKRVVRYQMNPRADWGPMNRAKGGG